MLYYLDQVNLTCTVLSFSMYSHLIRSSRLLVSTFISASAFLNSLSIWHASILTEIFTPGVGWSKEFSLMLHRSTTSCFAVATLAAAPSNVIFRTRRPQSAVR